MSTWLNHVVVAAPRNGSTSHTISPASGTVVAGVAFTPTAGRLLVCLVEGAVTSTTPSGWTPLASAVNYTGLYCWSRVAAGSDTITTTHNGANYPAAAEFWEFPAGTTVTQAVSAISVSGAGGAGPALSMPAGTRTIIAAAGQVVPASTVPTWTWADGTEQVDTGVAFSSTDGYSYSSTTIEGSTATSLSIAATSTDTVNPVERIILALQAALAGAVQAATTVVGALSRSTITGTAPATSTSAGTLPRSAVGGVVGAASTVSGTLTRGSVSGMVPASSAVAGAVAVSELAGVVAATTAVAGAVSASATAVAGTVTASSSAAGTLSRSAVAGVVSASSTVSGMVARSSVAAVVAATAATAGTLARSVVSAVVGVVSTVRGTLSSGATPIAPVVRALTVATPARALTVATAPRILTATAPIRTLTVVEDT